MGRVMGKLVSVGGEMILKEMPCQAAVEDCQVPSKIARKSTMKGKETVASEESVDRAGRPTCTTCTEVGAVDRNA